MSLSLGKNTLVFVSTKFKETVQFFFLNPKLVFKSYVNMYGKIT